MSFNSRSGKSRAIDMSYFLAQVMSKFTYNFGITFAKSGTYRVSEICRNENESTFRKTSMHYAGANIHEPHANIHEPHANIHEPHKVSLCINDIVSIAMNLAHTPPTRDKRITYKQTYIHTTHTQHTYMHVPSNYSPGFDTETRPRSRSMMCAWERRIVWRGSPSPIIYQPK